MDVFLIRHAEAFDETLTAHGRTQASSLGERLRWYDCAPARIWTSPLVRAVQTAELVATGLGCQSAVEVVRELAPTESEDAIVAAVQALPAETCVVLVGHEPNLSRIAALLLDRPDFAAFARAEAVRITDGRLRWRFAWDADAPATAG